jgi:hypothetical protein
MSIISEHERPEVEEKKDSDSGEQYQPTDEERNTLRLVEKIYLKNKRWRNQYDKKWMEYYKFFRGQQWSTQRPSYRHSEVINLCFQAIQSVVPIMTDSRPRWEFQPQDPSDREFAEIMNDMAEADWIKNNWLMTVTESVYDAHFYGTGISELYFDPNKKPLEGDICFQSTDPFTFYPDPNSTDVNKGGRNVVIAKPVEVSDVKREYPEKGHFVKADVIDALRGEKTDLEPIYQLRLPIDETKSMQGSGGSIEGLLDQKCLKKTVYMLSDETVETEAVDEMGMPVVEKRLKYPNGRKIVVAGGVVLEDGALPYEDGKFPFTRLLNYSLPREFWGISELEQLESPQKIFNKLVSFTLDVLTLTGNPVWVVDNTSGIDTDNITNRPGEVLEKNPGSEVRREPGVQLQSYILPMIDRMREYFVGLAGSQETTPPPGVTAAAAIADIQDAGQMYASRVLQYRDVPTVVRLTNNENATKYFKFHVKQLTDETGQPLLDQRGNPQRVAVIQHMGPNGEYAGQKEIPIKGMLDVKVSTGSTMPFMKAQKTRQALELFDRQVIDQEELLKTVEWPNREVVIQRMEQKAQMAAEAQQQAQLQMQASKNIPASV